MKSKILLTISQLFLLLPVLFAQPNNPPKPPSAEERLKHVSEKIEKEITMTATQKEKVKAAYKSFFASMDEARAKTTPQPPPPPPPLKKEDMDKLTKVRDEQIKLVLDAAQYKKYQEIEKTLHPPKPGGPPPPMNK